MLSTAACGGLDCATYTEQLELVRPQRTEAPPQARLSPGLSSRSVLVSRLAALAGGQIECGAKPGPQQRGARRKERERQEASPSGGGAAQEHAAARGGERRAGRALCFGEEAGLQKASVGPEIKPPTQNSCLLRGHTTSALRPRLPIRNCPHPPEQLGPAEAEGAPHGAGEPDPVARPQRARHHERVAAHGQQDGGQRQALQAGGVLRTRGGGAGRCTLGQGLACCCRGCGCAET